MLVFEELKTNVAHPSLKNICRLRDKEANVRTTLLPLDGV